MEYPEWFDSEKNMEIDSDIKNPCNYHNCRFSMIMTIDETLDKDLMIVLMNPSKATSENSDNTINRILNYAKAKYRRVYLYNTLPVYETISSKVKSVIDTNNNKDVLKVNTVAIINRLKKMDFNISNLILATGNPIPIYGEEVIDELYSALSSEEITISFFTKDGKTIEANEFKLNGKRYTKHLRVISNECLERELIQGNIDDLVKKEKGIS